jgi:ribonuclease Z
MLLRCEGRQILVDCGEGTQVAIREYGYGLKSIDGIAITHFHGDHFFGLPGLLQSLEHAGRTEPVWVAGPEGLAEMMERILGMTGDLSFPVVLRSEESFISASLLIETFPLIHRIPAQGYKFSLERAGEFFPEKAREYGVPVDKWSLLQAGETVGDVTPQMVMGSKRKGVSVVYATDTRPSETIVEAARGADLLIMDGTYPNEEKIAHAVKYGHMHFLEAATLATEAGVKEAWLTHFSHSIENPQEQLKAAQAIFSNIHSAYDGKKATLRFE